MTMTLADLRRKAGLSQAQMAKKMGVSNTQVSRIEASYPDVMFPSLRRYMDALGTTIKFVGIETECDSDDVEKDATRIYGETRRQDPTRAFGRKSA
jgi:transcriptional regulator with XRE-family HTH domain